MSWFSNALGFNPAGTQNVDTSQYTNMGNEFFDINSQRNRWMYNNLKQMGVDAIAQQYLNGARMQAQGANPFAQQQFRVGLSDARGQANNAYSAYMNNAYGIGSGLFGQALQGNLANAQARNMALMQANQNKTDFWSGLLSSVVQATPFAIWGFPGSGKGKLGGGTD